MRIGPHELKLERKPTVTGRDSAIISILAIIIGLAIFSIIFILAGVSPLSAYKEIFSYAFRNTYGISLTINRSIFLLLCTLGFILPFRAGIWNIGATGQFYLGALGAFGVLFAFGGRELPPPVLSPGTLIPLMIIGAALCGAGVGAIAGFLKGKLKINEILVTMMLNFVAFWFVSFMIKEGGLFMEPGGRGESFAVPPSVRAPTYWGVSFTIFIALGIAVLLYFLLAKTRIGYEIKALGHNPDAARYSGISPLKITLLVFIVGGAIAGLAGYHYFAGVPGVYKISRDYGHFGDMAFYGIVIGLISVGNPLAAIPVSLFFGGMTIGGRYAQGKFQMAFGVDYALLGILMITLIALQFFYHYKIVRVKKPKGGS